MSSLPVFADALSRLHADVAITRLVRAGIPAGQISVVFPRRRAPNSVACWLKNFRQGPLAGNLPMAAAGLLAQLFQPRQRRQAEAMEQRLQRLGLKRDVTARLQEKIENGLIVICVHARNETEVELAAHAFRQARAENISGGGDRVKHQPLSASTLLPEMSGLAA